MLDDAVAVLQSEGIEAAQVRGDVRSEESCDDAVESAVQVFGKLDILVNCAAGNFLSPAEGLTSKGFRTVMEIDCIGTFNMSRAAFPYLKEAGEAVGDAVIINITAGFELPPFFQAHVSRHMAIAGIWVAFFQRCHGQRYRRCGRPPPPRWASTP